MASTKFSAANSSQMDDLDVKPTLFDLKKEAQKVFDSILLDEPSNFYALYGKALTHYKDGRVHECIELINQALAVEPTDSSSKAKEMKAKIEKMIQMRTVQTFRGPVGMYRLPSSYKITHRLAPDAKDRVHHCKVCDKNFTKQFSLNRHMALHTGERPHKCSVCRKAFIQKTDMERHETTHSDILNFQCNQCDKRFKTKKNLTCHLITHSTDRPFQCRFCEKNFKVKRLLTFHEGLHKDVKPYNCDICGKGFPAKPYIKSHLKTHTDDKPFVCHICNFGFKRNYDLSFHIRNQHKDFLMKYEAVKYETAKDQD